MQVAQFSTVLNISTVWGPDFRRSERNFSIRQSPKLGLIFQKYKLKLLEI